MKNNKTAIIKIQNINEDIKNKIIKIINDFENKNPIPDWFKAKLQNLSDNDLWNNEYLMDYNTWTNRMINKKWDLEDVRKNDLSYEIILKLNDKCNFSEIISIISILEIDLKNVLIEDFYFGIYTPK
jgi:hypothetical protein